MKATINVGLVGYGFASKTFHAPLVQAVPGLELVAVSSSDASKVTADLPRVDVEREALVLCQRKDLDLIVIPTPNDTHFPRPRPRWRQASMWWSTSPSPSRCRRPGSSRPWRRIKSACSRYFTIAVGTATS